MTLKVIQGLVGSAPRQPSVNNNPPQNSNVGQEQQAAQARATLASSSSDAVVTAVRTLNKGASSVDKRLSADEAKTLATDVAKRIREAKEEGEMNPHSGLESIDGSTSAREHLYG